jgi:hypothetical protein
MAKVTARSTNNTSFHYVTFKATVNQLIQAFGQPSMEDNTGEDKTNFEWDMETNNEDVFTIYDWKEYRKLDLDSAIEWHIGSIEKSTSITAKEEILKSI